VTPIQRRDPIRQLLGLVTVERFGRMSGIHLVDKVQAVDDEAGPTIVDSIPDGLVAQHPDVLVPVVRPNLDQEIFHFGVHAFDHLKEVPPCICQEARKVVAPMEDCGQSKDLTDVGRGQFIVC